MKQYRWVAWIIVVVLLAVVALVNKGICGLGDGVMASRELDLPPFSSVELHGDMNVYITQADQKWTLIEAEQNILDHMMITVEDGVLIVDPGCMRPTKPIGLHIVRTEYESMEIRRS